MILPYLYPNLPKFIKPDSVTAKRSNLSKQKEDSEGEDNQARPFCLACLGKGGYYTYRFNGPNVWKDCRVCKRTVTVSPDTMKRSKSR